MPYNTVTVTPTLDTSAYATGDVLFIGTELKLPARACKLINIQGIWNDTEAETEIFGLYFFKENNHALGTINAAASITGAQLAENDFLGYTRVGNGVNNEQDLGTPSVLSVAGLIGIATDLSLVAGKGTEGSPYSIFIQALLEDGAGTFAADSLKLVFHFEY